MLKLAYLSWSHQRSQQSAVLGLRRSQAPPGHLPPLRSLHPCNPPLRYAAEPESGGRSDFRHAAFPGQLHARTGRQALSEFGRCGLAGSLRGLGGPQAVRGVLKSDGCSACFWWRLVTAESVGKTWRRCRSAWTGGVEELTLKCSNMGILSFNHCFSLTDESIFLITRSFSPQGRPLSPSRPAHSFASRN